MSSGRTKCVDATPIGNCRPGRAAHASPVHVHVLFPQEQGQNPAGHTTGLVYRAPASSVPCACRCWPYRSVPTPGPVSLRDPWQASSPSQASAGDWARRRRSRRRPGAGRVRGPLKHGRGLHLQRVLLRSLLHAVRICDREMRANMTTGAATGNFDANASAALP